MKLKEYINRLLNLFNLHMVKKNTFNHLREQALLLETKINDINNNNIKLMMESKWQCIDHFDHLMMPEHFTCKICAHENNLKSIEIKESACVFNGGKLIRYVCANCGVIFGPLKIMRLSDTELSREYEVLYKIYSEGDTTNNEIKNFHAMSPKKSGLYLNYGSGGGWNRSIEILRNEGWNIYGYEPFATNTPNAAIITDEKQIREMKFDGIMSNNLIEHLKDPIATFKLMRSLLKPEGVMVHATACYEYKYEFTRFHLFFFCGDSVNQLCKRVGLRITDILNEGEYIRYTYEQTPLDRNIVDKCLI